MNIRYGIGFRPIRKLAKYFLSAIYPLTIRLFKMPEVRSIDETLDKIIRDRVSIARFGDGELLYIVDELDLPFQVFDRRLKCRLVEILNSREENILVGLPVGYYSLNNLCEESRLTWRSQITWVYPRLRRYLDLNKVYYNASMTRVYIEYINKEHCAEWFTKLKSVWAGKEVVIIEGEKSRLGAGNDLFAGALRVERVLAPAHHAFSKYRDILDYAKGLDKTKIVLIALGPTATVLAFDLARLGCQALDIGNVDIEYEWFLRNSKTKEKIPHKYTSEVKGGRIVEDPADSVYQSQIVAKFI